MRETQTLNRPRIFHLSKELARPQPAAFLFIGLVLLAGAARLIPGPRTIDDAYITFRYARNILAGNGFTFNPGEHVLGTTTPLYTILLTISGYLTGGPQAPFPALALGLNTLADAATCLLLVRLGTKLGSLRAGWGAALVWAIAPYSVTFAIGGMETSVYVFLLVALAVTYLEGRYPWAALLAALALLTRPDALILLGPLAVDRLIRTFFRSPLSLKEIGAFLIPTLPWLLFATLYFGSPLPHSIAAKSLAYRLGPEAAFIRLLQHYATPFLGNLTFGTAWIGIGMVLYPFLFLVGAWKAMRNRSHSGPFLAYPWLYFAAFAIANPLIFRWYLTPPLPFYFLGILLGADHFFTSLLQALSNRRNKRDSASQTSAPPLPPVAQIALTVFILTAPLVLTLRGWVLRPDHGLSRPAPDMAWYQLELLYRQAAGTLAPEIRARPGKIPVLAAGDVGVLGFYTGARILDTVGLNSPGSTPYYPLDPAFYTINYAIPPDLILDQKPDYIVILEVYGRKGLLQDPRFWKMYTLQEKLPTDIYGSDGMLIFVRRVGE